MAYCTIDQLQARYGLPLLLQVSDRDDTFPTVPDETIFDRAIADADALIDGYLAARYALPLISVPALLVDLSQVIAIYKAHPSVAAEKIRKDYEDALKQLKAIAAGEISLDVAGIEPEGAGASEVVTLTSPNGRSPPRPSRGTSDDRRHDPDRGLGGSGPPARCNGGGAPRAAACTLGGDRPRWRVADPAPL